MTAEIADPVQSATGATFADEQVVVLRVHGGDYAVPIGRVQEIVRVPEITQVPEAGMDVEGVINLRGRVLPVINLASRLGLGYAERARQARIVVVDGQRGKVGLLVDGVSEVLRISARDIEPPSEVATGSASSSVCGVAKLGERLILLLELDVVLARG